MAWFKNFINCKIVSLSSDGISISPVKEILLSGQ